MSHLPSEISSIYIKSIEIKKFRRHKNTLLVFEKDSTNIILGENGVGKSSVFIAIVYALFGIDGLKYYERGRTKWNLIKRGERESKVKLELGVIDIKGNEYTITIERTLNSFSGSERAILKVNNFVVCSGSERVKEFVMNELFKITTKEIIELIYARQGELGNYIRNLYTVERSNFLDRILQLDKLSELIQELKQKWRELNIELLNIRNTIKRYTEDYERMKQYLMTQGIDIDKISVDELIKLNKEKNKLENILNKFRELYIRINELKNQIDEKLILREEEIKNEISNIYEETKKLENERSKIYEEISKLHQEIPRIEKTIEISQDSIEKLFIEAKNNFSEQKLHEIKSKLKEVERDIKFLAKDYNINNIEEQLKSYNDKLEQLNSEKAIIESKIKETKKLLELIKKGELEKCPICDSDIKNKYHEILAKKENELNELENKLSSLDIMIKKYKNDLNELEKVYENIKYIMTRYGIVSGNVKKELEKMYNNLHNEYEQLLKYGSVIYYKLKEQISIKNKEMKEIESKLNKLRNKKYSLETQLNEIEKMKNIKQSISKLKQEIYELIKNANIEFSENESLEQILKKIEDRYNNLPEVDPVVLDSLKFYSGKINYYKSVEEELLSKIETLDQILKLYEDLRTLIRSYFIKKFSAILTYWFKKLYVYPDIVSIEINIEEAIRSDQNVYVLYVKFSDGSKKDIREAGLSGGQLVALELAFRLSLINLLIKRVKFILLDEPTHSLDENVRSKLTEIMKDFKDFQIIACTHDEIFKEAASGKCYYLKRDEENNTVVESLN